MTRHELAMILKIKPSDIRRYERGNAVIPDAVLFNLFINGVHMLRARKLN